jgi:hypothetical protein
MAYYKRKQLYYFNHPRRRKYIMGPTALATISKRTYT